MRIVLTKHARKKFRDFAKIGVVISKRQVTKTIQNPEHIDKESDAPKIIASRSRDDRYIIRVVFKIEDDIIRVITFYPARRGRYYEEKN